MEQGGQPRRDRLKFGSSRYGRKMAGMPRMEGEEHEIPY